MYFNLYDIILSPIYLDNLLVDFRAETAQNGTKALEIDSLKKFFLKERSSMETLKIFQKLEESILSEQTKELRQINLEHFLSSLDYYIDRIKSLTDLDNDYPFFLNDLLLLKEDVLLKYQYMLTKEVSSGIKTNPKIQWLGNTNVLATLIYELWNGQEKGKNQPSTKPLIKAQKKDLEELLINNFLDQQGKPLTISTVSDYLNSSKPEKRAKKNGRIELDY